MKQSNRIHIFKGLSNVTRLAIIDALRSGDMVVSDICEATGFEQSRVSHALKYLEKNCFVEGIKDGKFVSYRLNRSTLLPIVIMADEHINKYASVLNHSCECKACIEGSGKHSCECSACQGRGGEHSCKCEVCRGR